MIKHSLMIIHIQLVIGGFSLACAKRNLGAVRGFVISHVAATCCSRETRQPHAGPQLALVCNVAGGLIILTFSIEAA